MDRCALFVDASYLLADGAMAVHGTRHRETVSWDFPGLLQFLNNLARDRTGLRLLRCYWYEATAEGRRTPEHDALADLPGLKLRLGRMRPGRREGVDTHVYRDLLTLAREHAVCDAVLVSGDEDMTQAVSDAQDLGVRVTVVHVAVDGNWTISRSLRHECDDLIEISSSHLRPFVNLLAGIDTSAPPLSNGQSAAPPHLQPAHHAGPHPAATHHTGPHPAIPFDFTPGHPSGPQQLPTPSPAPTPQGPPSSSMPGHQGPHQPAPSGPLQQPTHGHQTPPGQAPPTPSHGQPATPHRSGYSDSLGTHSGPLPSPNNSGGINRNSGGMNPGPAMPDSGPIPPTSGPMSPASGPIPPTSGPMSPTSGPISPHAGQPPDSHSAGGPSFVPQQQPQAGYANAPIPEQSPSATPTLSDAVGAAHQEGSDFGDSVARDAPALWLEAVLARKPRMPSDLEARLLQGSSLPIDFLLHDEVRHALRRGFWDALERSRRS